jgi:hypothetical protein
MAGRLEVQETSGLPAQPSLHNMLEKVQARLK